MCQKLGLANYTGPILLEVLMTHSRFRDAEDFLGKAHAVAQKTWEAIRGGAQMLRRTAED